MTDPAPQESKPRKRAERPADEAHATLRQSRARQVGDQLRISLSVSVSQEIATLKEELRSSPAKLDPGLVDRAVEKAIHVALSGNVRDLTMHEVQTALAGLLAPAGGTLTTSPPDQVIEIDERGKVHPPSAGPQLAKARERGASGAEGG